MLLLPAVLITLLSALSPASAVPARGYGPVRARSPAPSSLAGLPSSLVKKLSGPPSEFASMRLPDPSKQGVPSDSGLVPVYLTPVSSPNGRPGLSRAEETRILDLDGVGDERMAWEGDLPVDSATRVQFTVFTRVNPDDLVVTFSRPGDKGFAAVGAESGRAVEDAFGVGGNVVPSVTYWFDIPRRGMWRVRIESTSSALSAGLAESGKLGGVAGRTAKAPHMVLMMSNESPETVVSYFDSFESLKVGNQVAFRVHVYDNNVPRDVAEPRVDFVRSANLALILPDGTERHYSMSDDGQGTDLVAGDGVWGAVFDATEVGEYLAEVIVDGVNSNGDAFYRTSVHLLPIVRGDIALSSAAARSHREDHRIVIGLETDLTPSAAEEAFAADNGDSTHRVYAEVWATPTAGGDKVPVAWVSGMAPLTTSAGGSGHLAFDLELDARWLTRANAAEPLELREVRVQERNTWVPVAMKASVPVDDAPSARAIRAAVAAAAAHPSGPGTTITRDMREGRHPFRAGAHDPDAVRYHRERGWAVPGADAPAPATADATGRGGKLLLVHGYCAPVNAFPLEDFEDAVKFEDLNENRATDVFARLIMELGNKYPSFSIFAHSHGGVASTHLHAFYFSNLEEPDAGDGGVAPARSPADLAAAKGGSEDGTWYVASAAGAFSGSDGSTLGAIGSLIGIGCGSNADLVPDAAAAWKAGIPDAIQHDVHFYRVKPKKTLLSTWCLAASNLVLGSLNDGVIPLDSSLPGGIDMGVKEGWCHSGARGDKQPMKWPGLLTDAERNAVVNKSARR